MSSISMERFGPAASGQALENVRVRLVDRVVGRVLSRKPSPDVEDHSERFSNLRKAQRPNVASSHHDPLR